MSIRGSGEIEWDGGPWYATLRKCEGWGTLGCDGAQEIPTSREGGGTWGTRLTAVRSEQWPEVSFFGWHLGRLWFLGCAR